MPLDDFVTRSHDKCHLKKAGTKVLASSCFWIVEQDAVVEWALLR